MGWNEDETETFSDDSLIDCLWKAVVSVVDPDAIWEMPTGDGEQEADDE